MRQPFEDEEDFNQNNNIKLDAKKSRFNKQLIEKNARKQSLKDKVEDIQEKNNSIEVKAFELSSQYVSFLYDKTLNENKSPIKIDFEKEIINNLSELALNLNNDESKPEGIGSVGLNTLLLKCLLKQRDIINELSYEVHNLKKILKSSGSSDEK